MSEIEPTVDEEIIFEVRGRDNSWRVHYIDEGDIKTKLHVYDKEGNLKTILWVGGDSGKLTESYIEFSTAKEAIKYAEEIGADKVRLIKTKERKKKEPVE